MIAEQFERVVKEMKDKLRLSAINSAAEVDRVLFSRMRSQTDECPISDLEVGRVLLVRAIPGKPETEPREVLYCVHPTVRKERNK